MDSWLLNDFNWIWEGIHGSVDLIGFVGFWLDLRRISMDPWILEDVVGSGKDFYETVDLGRFWLDLGRISMDP